MGLFRTAAKVSVATRVHGRAQRNQQQRWAQQDQAAPTVQTAQPAAPAAAAGLSMDDKLAQLKQLGDLRDAGIISEAEFEIKKHQVLNG